MTASSFTFFASYYEALQHLPDKDFGKMIKAICEYALNGKEPDITIPTLKGYFALIRPTLDRYIQRAQAGRKGGQKGTGVSRNQGNNNASKSKANQKQINTYKDKDKEKDKEKELRDGIDKENKAIAYPYDEVVRLWNELCSPLPKVMKLTDSRRKKIKSRLIEFSKESNEWLPKTRELFERVVSSDFLCGEKSDWQATFDWLFDNPKNWVKVMEGNYDNERHRNGTKPKTTLKGVRLGEGEYIDNEGNRRYSDTLPPVPMSAPPRPSKDLVWSRETNSWIPPGI